MTDDEELIDQTHHDLAERAEAAAERADQKKTEAFSVWVDIQAEWHNLVRAVKQAKAAGITGPKVVPAIKKLGRKLADLLGKLEIKGSDSVTKRDLERMDDILSGKAASKLPKQKKEKKDESDD